MSKKMYPYIPNSEAAVQAEMLKFIGVDSVEELIADIPEAVSYTHLDVYKSQVVMSSVFLEIILI